ncbi:MULTISPECIES: amidohydrolase family protein [unclassified Ensifer]|uniref:amidohydrolase family protein n=1 Tax=unclassified Ensifer TaxID=2633371 RepID=UPI000710945A|nr:MULTISPECIES: amidohydrolase family protein [unclassified Ensifer]KQW59147.1 amidohydrolase [Ensifer sp. Root1252]KQW79478.1 amidohydrolase [Ensifer sp. Root127]KRC74128.1 amidohydrolase [Ensifer sp. Root231]KRC97143.1 amidohydrolase [Ensifer sp. Root258]
MLVRTLSGRPPKNPLPKGTVDTQMHMYLPGFPALAGGPALPAGALPDADQYRKLMRWLGVDRVIITQGNAHQRDNTNLIACLNAMGPSARGVAAFGAETSERELDTLSDAGVIGARIMDLPGGAVGLDELEAVDDRAAARGWMVAIQFDGSNILQHEPRLQKLKSRWVFDHHGKFFSGAAPDGPEVAAVKRLIDGGNCWFKFAGVYESSKTGGPDFADVAALSRAVVAHAPERVVWGSNWPHNIAKTNADYPDDAELTDTVLGWLPDAGARHRVLVENPERLFGLKPFTDRGA